MRRFLRGRDRRRSKQRGAVAVEFALSMIFLVPLLLGTLDYGYYFWVALNAIESARAGAKAAIATSGLTGCPAGVVTTAQGNAVTAVTGGSGQMLHVFTAANAVAYTTFLTNTCATTPANPSWQIRVEVDFPPAVGFLSPWMPASTLHSGWVRYRTSTVVTTTGP